MTPSASRRALSPTARSSLAGKRSTPTGSLHRGRRFNADGSLDWSFIGDGLQTTEPLEAPPASRRSRDPGDVTRASSGTGQFSHDFVLAPLRHCRFSRHDFSTDFDGVRTRSPALRSGTAESSLPRLAPPFPTSLTSFRRRELRRRRLTRHHIFRRFEPDPELPGLTPAPMTLPSSDGRQDVTVLAPRQTKTWPSFDTAPTARPTQLLRRRYADCRLCVAMRAGRSRLQADGKIVIAGPYYSSSDDTSGIAILRLNSDGSLDSAFSGDGKQTTYLPPRDQDGDGVPDVNDSCPTESGPASNDGCPESAPPDGHQGPTAACKAAEKKLHRAKAALKKARKTHKPAKIKRAKKKVKKAKAEVKAAC